MTFMYINAVDVDFFAFFGTKLFELFSIFVMCILTLTLWNYMVTSKPNTRKRIIITILVPIIYPSTFHSSGRWLFCFLLYIFFLRL